MLFNPGWVDLQVNGHNGVDYSEDGLTADKFLKSAEELLASGTEIFLPTIVTGALKKNSLHAALIMDTVEKHGLEKHIPGIHFEGPFICPTPGAVGAHNPNFVCAPTVENMDILLDSARGKIKIVTLGADSENAAEAVAYLKKNHVAVSVGHHMANYEQVRRAADAGAKLLTHLGNGCPNLLDRHHNPVFAGLAEERLTAMIITDGHHLPGELVRIIIRTKGVDKIIVTSDASSLTGFPPGEYGTLGNRAVLYPNGKLFNPDKQCLVGSAYTISQCMTFLASLDFLTQDELTRVGRLNALELLKSTEA
jgi:N-acetylglucosamine-6-phosphate deacetylase